SQPSRGSSCWPGSRRNGRCAPRGYRGARPLAPSRGAVARRVVWGAAGEGTRRVRGHEPTTRGGAEDAAEGGGAPTQPGQKSSWVPSCRRLPSVITQPGFPKSLFVLVGVGTKLLMHPKFW